MPNATDQDDNAWAFRAKVAFGFFAIIAAFFVIAEHCAHLVPYLPLLLLAACPLIHVFMHHGHGNHGGHSGHGGRDPPDEDNEAAAGKVEGSGDGDTTPKHDRQQQNAGGNE